MVEFLLEENDGIATIVGPPVTLCLSFDCTGRQTESNQRTAGFISQRRWLSAGAEVWVPFESVSAPPRFAAKAAR